MKTVTDSHLLNDLLSDVNDAGEMQQTAGDEATKRESNQISRIHQRNVQVDRSCDEADGLVHYFKKEEHSKAAINVVHHVFNDDVVIDQLF